MKRIVESKLNIKKVNPSCLFVGAIPSYEPSDMFEDSLQRRSSQAVQSGEVLLGKFVIEDATEEVRQEEKTAQPIFLLASSNLGDEILRRRHLLFAGLPSISRGDRRRRVPAVVQWRCRHCTTSSRPCRAAQVRAGCAVSSFVVAASTSTPACSLIRPETAVAAPASPSSSSPASFRPPLPPPQLVGLLHHHHPRHCSGKVALALALAPPSPERRRGVVRAVLVSVQPLPAALVTSSPVPVVVVVVVLSSFPVVVAFVPPSSRSCPSSASIKIAAEVVPSPFVSVVPGRLRRARCAVVGPGTRVPVSACSFACVLRVAFIVPEVPEAWFVVVAEGSEGRSL
uniref:Cell wall protein-like n=1 Tax=Oryza sativa subsp. japonica TaxID=39947 RepID=Q6K2M8_ORYSJ|nr:cell wall protein-like [Oryza sativa Japonica Group]